MSSGYEGSEAAMPAQTMMSLQNNFLSIRIIQSWAEDKFMYYIDNFYTYVNSLLGLLFYPVIIFFIVIHPHPVSTDEWCQAMKQSVLSFLQPFYV